ncbi:MAG: hypothetical protein RIE53_09900 [Rhodothermales bacterium]
MSLRFASLWLPSVSCVLLVLTVLASPTPALARQSSVDPFDFQMGVWRVQGMQSWPGGKWVPFDAVVHIQPAWQGPWPSIREAWWPVHAPLFGPPSLGWIERVYHPERAAWHMRYNGSTTPAFWPEFAHYERRGTQVVMPETPMTDITGPHLQRLTIDLVNADGWSLNAERSYNGGMNWFSWVLMEAERLPTTAEGRVLLPGPLSERAHVETILTGFTGSRGIALDDAGSVILGTDGGAIVRVSPDGRQTVLAEGLKPAGLAWSQGHVYAKAHDVPGGRLVRISPDGTVRHLSDAPGDGLAVDRTGNAYTTDFNEPVLLKTTPEGEMSVLARDERLRNRLGSAFDNDTGRLYLASWDGNIISVSAEGEVREVVDIPAVSGSGVAWMAMADGVLYTTQFSAEQVYAYDTVTGTLRVVAGDGLPGHRDGAAHNARFRAPNGIAVTPDADTLYVAELVDPVAGVYPENRLRRIVLSAESERARETGDLIGQRLAFVSQWGDENLDVYVMEATGGGKRRLTTHEGEDRAPRWVDAWNALVYEHGGRHLVRVNAWGGEAQRLGIQGVPEPPPSERSANMSPDGTRMVMTRGEGEASELYVMNADGSDARKITDNHAFDGHPVWSPDGQKIAFQSRRDGSDDIYIMNPDGTEVKRLTMNPGYDGEPAWIPIITHSTKKAEMDAE